MNKYLSSHTFDQRGDLRSLHSADVVLVRRNLDVSAAGRALRIARITAPTRAAGARSFDPRPYPSCSGCHATGCSTVQDAQHFACRETRLEAGDGSRQCVVERTLGLRKPTTRA